MTVEMRVMLIWYVFSWNVFMSLFLKSLLIKNTFNLKKPDWYLFSNNFLRS